MSTNNPRVRCPCSLLVSSVHVCSSCLVFMHITRFHQRVHECPLCPVPVSMGAPHVQSQCMLIESSSVHLCSSCPVFMYSIFLIPSLHVCYSCPSIVHVYFQYPVSMTAASVQNSLLLSRFPACSAAPHPLHPTQLTTAAPMMCWCCLRLLCLIGSYLWAIWIFLKDGGQVCTEVLWHVPEVHVTVGLRLWWFWVAEARANRKAY